MPPGKSPIKTIRYNHRSLIVFLTRELRALGLKKNDKVRTETHKNRIVLYPQE